MIRKIIFHFFFLVAIVTQAQQRLAFSFGETPQTLMLNPGSETNYKSHYGIPIVSNFQLTIGNSGFQMGDLFSNDSRSFNEKFEKVLDQISPSDYINLNTKIDVLNFGYRYNNKTYISIGFYEEFDLIAYFPKDAIEGLYYGNDPFFNRSFSVSQAIMKADLIGVLHAGISKKIDEKLTIGARFKIYSSSLNIETNNNSGSITTITNNINLDIEPEYTSPLVFFKLDQRDFLDENNQEISVVSDITDFRVLDNTVLKENLVELAIDFEIENGFNRSFLVDFIFLDEDENITYNVDDLSVNAGNLNYSSTRSILIETTPEFLNSTKIRVDIFLSPSSTILNPDIEKTFKFRSSGTCYMKY